MTTIITRAFGDKGKANAAAKALHRAGFLPDMIDVIESGEGLPAAMAKAEVAEEVAAAYAKKLKEGQAALVARVPFFPLGAARTAMGILDKQKPLKVDVPKAETYKRSEGLPAKAAAGGGAERLLPSGRPAPGNTISDVKFWGQKVIDYPHLSDRKPRADSIRHGFWGELIPHISQRKPRADSIQHGFWGRLIPHLSDRKPPDNCIDRGGHWATRVINYPLIISR